MSVQNAEQNSYLQSLLSGHPAPETGKQSWLNALRGTAVETVSSLTIPTTRDEEWRFTDLSMLTKISLQPAQAEVKLSAASIQPFHIKEAGARLVFVDGIFSAALSSVQASGITVGNLATALASHSALLQQHLPLFIKNKNAECAVMPDVQPQFSLRAD